MKFLDRLADRMMDALPRASFGTIALTAVGIGALFGAVAWWLGPVPTGLLLLAGVGLAARWLWRQAGFWRMW